MKEAAVTDNQNTGNSKASLPDTILLYLRK